MNYKKLFLILSITILIFLFFGCTKSETPIITLPEGKTAKITFLVGDVFVQKAGTNWIKAEIGDTLNEGVVLKTGENSYCEIVISSGTLFRMKDKSELKLSLLPDSSEDNKSKIRLFAGSLFAKVNKIAYKSNVTIETDSTTLGVRGTEFLVYVENDIKPYYTQLLVAKGKVNTRLNIYNPYKEAIPKNLRTVFKSINRGVNIKEGYKIYVQRDKVENLNEVIKRYSSKKTIEDQEVAKLKREIMINPVPLNKEDKERLKELKSISLSFNEGKTYSLSPNFDGVNDDLIFSTIGFKDEKLYGWNLVILDGRSKLVKLIKNRINDSNLPLTLPETIIWNMVNERGNIVKDGNYIYEFYTHGKYGRRTLRTKGIIVVDTVPPLLKLDTDDITFSPNGDNIKDAIKIKIEAEKEIEWSCSITTQEGIIVKTLIWGKSFPEIFEWDGKGDNGNILPEGVYDIIMSGEDTAGNKTKRTLKGITIDVRARSASIDIDNPIFSPNGDGILDTVTFKPILSDRYRIDTWDLVVQTDKGDTAMRFRGRRSIPQSLVWDGKTKKGSSSRNLPKDLPSGKYLYFLKVIYRSGVNTYAFKKELILDNDPPEIGLAIDPAVFSPDGDGIDDKLFIRSKIEDMTQIISWKATIYDSNAMAFKTFTGQNMPKEEIIWDGISDAGQLVDSGEDYYIVMEAEDSGHNIGLSEKILFSIDILVIPTERGLKIRVSNIEFGFDNANLKGEKTYQILEKIVKILKKYNKYSIIVEGYTDSTGDESYNIALSKKRAETVGEWLIKNGIDQNRLSYEGYGPKLPIDTNATKEGRARNRRVEFILKRK